MKRLFLLLICWGSMFSSCTYCQTYFNNRYNIAGEWATDLGMTVISTDDSYIIGCETNFSINTVRTRIALSILNLDGELQTVKYFEHPEKAYCVGFPGFIIKSISDGFWLAGGKRDNFSRFIHDKGLLMRLDENCDSLWTREYGDMVEPYDTMVRFKQIHTTNDGKLTVLGEARDFTSLGAMFYLLHLDSLGNKLWEKYYGQAPDSYYPFYLASTSDKGYVMSGKESCSEQDSSQVILIKTDSVGKSEWSRHLGIEYTNALAMVDSTIDGQIIVATAITDSVLSDNYFLGKINYIKLDNSGTVIWDKKYGGSNINTHILSMKSLPDGRIISTGSRETAYPACPDIVGWIFCTNSSGDSLWYREYDLLNGEYSMNFLYDISPAADNGFIACGYVSPASQDTGSQDTWVLKVDSIGCESLENCWAGVDEKPEIVPPEPFVINVFPNPSNDKVFFEFSSGLKPEEMDLAVFNLMGVTVFHQPVHLSSGLFELDISSWPAGMYIARIVFMNEVTGTVKFVKE